MEWCTGRPMGHTLGCRLCRRSIPLIGLLNHPVYTGGGDGEKRGRLPYGEARGGDQALRWGAGVGGQVAVGGLQLCSPLVELFGLPVYLGSPVW
jgi:hypothetical protein